MLRVRFYQPGEDYRPVIWPVPHPYWCTGSTDDHDILVAYVDSIEQLRQQWPEAERIEVTEENTKYYAITERFPVPDWLDTSKMVSKEERFIPFGSVPTVVTKIYPGEYP